MEECFLEIKFFKIDILQKIVELSAFINKKIGSGLFGGEGFVMQKISGSGIAFCEFDGDLIEYELKAGEKLKISSGYLAAM